MYMYTYLCFREPLHLLTSSFPITAEMFTGSSRYTINDGEFTTTGNSSGFANNSDFVINGGNFVASSSTSHASMHYQAPMNHGTVQGNAPPRPYNGGNFGAFSSTSYASMHYQAPMNIGTAQGNAPPRPYQGHQGKSETALLKFLSSLHRRL